MIREAFFGRRTGLTPHSSKAQRSLLHGFLHWWSFRLRQDGAHHVRRVLVDGLKEMRIDREGSCGVRVPQPTRDLTNGDSGRHQSRRGEVAKVMQTY